MIKVSDAFVSRYLYNKLLDAVKDLNEFNLALADGETELRERVDGIIKEIVSIEV